MRVKLFVATAAVLSASLAAHADTFLFTATAPATAVNSAVDVTATLTGTADPNVVGAFDLTSGSGTVNGTAITLYSTGLITAGSYQTANFSSPPFTYNTSYEYDNVVYTSGNGGLALDEYGLLFSEPDDHFNPYSEGPGYVYSDDETLYGYNAPLYTLTLTDLGPSAPPSSVTPEPSSILLLGTGLLGIAGVVRKRFA